MNKSFIDVLLPSRLEDLVSLQKSIDSVINHPLLNHVILILDRPKLSVSKLNVNSYRKLMILESPGVGIGTALNFGISQSEAPLLARQDGDDISLPNRFYFEVDKLNNEGYDAVFSKVANLETRITIDRPIGPILEGLLFFNCSPIHPTLVCKRSFFENNAYPSTISEDYALWMKSLNLNNSFTVPYVNYLYNVRSNSTSQVWNRKQVLLELYAFWVNLGLKLNIPKNYLKFSIWKSLYLKNLLRHSPFFDNFFQEYVENADIPYYYKRINLDYYNSLFVNSKVH
jgi:hypothetical protein